MKQVVRSRHHEISNPLNEISFFGKTREEPAEHHEDEEYKSEEDHPTVTDEPLSKPKKKRIKRKIQGKRQTLTVYIGLVMHCEYCICNPAVET